MSSLEARRPAILVEGIPLSGFENKGLVTEQTNKSRMEELARSVAVKEVELNEVNINLLITAAFLLGNIFSLLFGKCFSF